MTKRIPGLFVRFGVTESKIASYLHRFVGITEQFETYPTFAITANLIPRYPKLIRALQERGVEFAIHGLVHTDYAQLSLDEQRTHLEQAMSLFDGHGVNYSGFRCPYLSSNHNTLVAVREMGLRWESSDVVSWDVLDFSKHTTHQIDAYKKVIDLYGAKSTVTEKSIPRTLNGLVEIPVSVPDDEALVDRLGVRNPSEIASVWLAILRETYNRGEVFTIQLHHERIDFCAMALTRVLGEARSFQPPVWISQLKDISEWQLEFEGMELQLEHSGESRFRVKVKGSSRATVLVKNASINTSSRDWMDGYRLIDADGVDEFEVASGVKPAIGVSPQVPGHIIDQLKNEGFIAEVADINTGRDYSVYIKSVDGISFDELLKSIDGSEKPVIRLWRWPYGARSALACTGDIDSITIIDFARRFIEV